MGKRPTLKAVMACAEWLRTCLRLGWSRADLDALETLWWKYHDPLGRLMAPEGGRGA